VLGIVENMAAFTDPASGARVAFFGEGGGQRLADEVGVPLLGSVALVPGLAALADQGEPIVVAEPDSAAARALMAIAERVDRAAAARGMSLPVITQ
jgi:ATP-binding protein involved in chromosome partitioning